MAAPVFAQWYSYSFRDAKRQTSRMRILIGGASAGAVETESQSLAVLMRPCTNATVWLPNQDGPVHTPGAAAQFQNVEDKASLTFLDPAGRVHRYRLPAPLATQFDADLETVNPGATAMAALLAAWQANVYGSPTDASPLTYVGGVRTRVKLIRRINIFTLDPTEVIPAE